MSLRLVPNSVTLDDLERRNSPNRRVISPNSEVTPILSTGKCRPKNVVFGDISFMAILADGEPERER